MNDGAYAASHLRSLIRDHVHADMQEEFGIALTDALGHASDLGLQDGVHFDELGESLRAQVRADRSDFLVAYGPGSDGERYIAMRLAGKAPQVLENVDWTNPPPWAVAWLTEVRHDLD